MSFFQSANRQAAKPHMHAVGDHCMLKPLKPGFLEAFGPPRAPGEILTDRQGGRPLGRGCTATVPNLKRAPSAGYHSSSQSRGLMVVQVQRGFVSLMVRAFWAAILLTVE